ncbi:hypothetical protein L3Y34_003135 [Caenorhabditis briggsae]|uniref:PAN-3 domain-containing protein n=1 Tax=Caenorhabditis briggsae TaxID=6238 RepID=A0AAE9D3A5_CAEBR|nr:hypothetical protein L3Y34_003135 [Caenorhabditis briggsae]
MIVVYGFPQSASGCKDFDGTWDECVQYCFHTETCVFVTLFTDTMTCVACLYENVISQIYRREEGNKVVIKITLDKKWNDTCPLGIKYAPTFLSSPVVGDASTTKDGGKIQNYTITWDYISWKFKTCSV